MPYVQADLAVLFFFEIGVYFLKFYGSLRIFMNFSINSLALKNFQTSAFLQKSNNANFRSQFVNILSLTQNFIF